MEANRLKLSPWKIAKAIWHRDTLTRLNAFFNDRKFVEGEMKRVFDDAKRLSDFVGILTRIAFTVGFVIFCKQKYDTSSGWYDIFTFQVCIGVGTMYAFWMAYKVANIMSLFIVRDMAAGPSWVYKVFIMALGLATYFSLLRGITSVVLTTAAAIK